MMRTHDDAQFKEYVSPPSREELGWVVRPSLVRNFPRRRVLIAVEFPMIALDKPATKIPLLFVHGCCACQSNELGLQNESSEDRIYPTTLALQASG